MGGKEAFSTIQAALFPEFFALQTASCMLALGGHTAVSGFDVASTALLVAVGLALTNLLALGPISMPYMLALYKTNPDLFQNAPTEEALLPLAKARKKFGMIHGMSMLVDIGALAATLGYMILVVVNA